MYSNAKTCAIAILANFQISQRGTNERKCLKKRDIPTFPILYYIQIFEKRGTQGKISLFCFKMRDCPPQKGTVGHGSENFDIFNCNVGVRRGENLSPLYSRLCT